MNPSSAPEISVVILCYRAGAFARTFHARVTDILKEDHLNYEIILVGNYLASREDDTPRVVAEIAKGDPRTRAVIKEKTNLTDQGMGWDMRTGLETASGNVIAVIDGDGQMPPEDIPKLYKKLKKEKLDLCKARRVTRGDGPYRKFISGIFNFLMSVLFPGIVANDINAKPKILTRSAYEKMNLESNTWFIDAEMMINARRLKLRIGELETVFYENPERRSFISLKANIEFLKNIFVWRIKEFKK